MPCPPPGNLPNPGIPPTSLMSPALAGGFLTTSTTLGAPENLTTVYFSSPLSFLNHPDNHAHEVTQLEPDILECEVSWALGSVNKNKASRSDGIPAELFQILKVMLSKCCTQHASKLKTLSNGCKTGTRQFSFQSQRRAMMKNVQKLPYNCAHLTCWQDNAENPSS